MMPSIPDSQLVQSILGILQAQFSSASRLYDLSIAGVQEASAPNTKASSAIGGSVGGFLPGQTFMVEAYTGLEALHCTSQWSILVLSTDAHFNLSKLLGKVCQLHTTLSDGSRVTTSGLIRQVALIGSEGGLARYRLSVVDWTWMLGQSVASRVWQDTGVLEIAESIFARYAPQAAWAVSDDVGPFLQDMHNQGNLSYCVQYRETDLAFCSRLLASQGLSWRMEEHAESAAKHRMVIFADSTQSGGQTSAFADNTSNASALGASGNAPAGRGIRFHRGAANEVQDSMQALAALRSLPSAIVTLLSTDYKSKSAVAASAPTNLPFGGKEAPQLESYLPQAPYAAGNRQATQRLAELRQQALEARHLRYGARTSVRSLRTGQRIHITHSPVAALSSADHPGLNVLATSHFGINNLPKQAKDSIAQLLGQAPKLLAGLLAELQAQASGAGGLGTESGFAAHLGAQSADSPSIHYSSSYGIDSSLSSASTSSTPLPLDHSAALLQAQAIGYANVCELLEAQLPWRPLLPRDAAGSTLQATPSAPGAQTALVVGPNGTDSDTSAGDVYTDKLGRIRIRLLWQGSLADADGSTSGSATCWVRVAQRSAGAGMGLQFIPRVGQEVLVQFLGGDINRPIALGALYNGQGEGGLRPSPAGADSKDSQGSDQDSNPFASSSDTRAAAQANLMAAGTGGKSPAWFGSAHGKHGQSEAGVSAGGQANSAAQWGIRTKEWGNTDLSAGYNQLVFDDNDGAVGGNQQRIHLKTTQSATELSLGHLVHAADNHRGSLRGQGFELRTDAYGALRAGHGLHLSTYSIQHSATTRDPAGDNSGALALLKQAKVLSETFSKAAGTHSTVKLASHVGSIDSNQSALDDKASPMAALYKMAATQVGHKDLDTAQGDAPKKQIAPKPETLPHSGDAILSLAGQGGLAAVAGQSLQLSNSETTSLMSGQDSQSITGGSLRVHTGQAIGILAGAVDKGEQGKGLTLIASKDPVRYEAQSNEIKIQAKQLINIQSANAHIDWAAAKKISLSTSGGANITIEGGNITVQCPGKLTVHASSKKFDGPAQMSYPLPVMPSSVPIPIKFALKLQDMSGAHGVAPKGEPWKIVVSDVKAGSGPVPPEIFNADEWRETLFSGSVGAEGDIKLSDDEQKELFQRVRMQPGAIWLVSGLTAMPLKPAQWSQKKGDVVPEKILDSLNFASDGRSLAEDKRDWLAELAKEDGEVQGLNSLKNKTEA
jgi:type VI secretion system secreted protein VgrG